MVISERPGRASASASPRLIGRGSGSAASSGSTRLPRPAVGAVPMVIAATALIRPARQQGAAAASAATRITAASTAASTGIAAVKGAGKPSALAVSCRKGWLASVPSGMPIRQPSRLGARTCPSSARTTWIGAKPTAFSTPISR